MLRPALPVRKGTWEVTAPANAQTMLQLGAAMEPEKMSVSIALSVKTQEQDANAPPKANSGRREVKKL